MFINNFDPVAIQLFSLEIKWYSLAYIFGILVGWILSKKIFITDQKIREKFDDYISYLIIGIIIGGRLGYVLFYNLDYFLNNPIDIFKIWEGGMSFHGGLIGIIIVSILFAKKNNQDPFSYLDIVSLVAPIGIFFGRTANFINSELYGIETSLPWGVKFIKVDSLFRHPSQLYEAFFEGLLLFIILLIFFIRRSKFRNFGVTSGLFLFFYGFFRFFIEYLREPDSHLGLLFNFISMGQLLSIPLFIFGIILIQNNAFRK